MLGDIKFSNVFYTAYDIIIFYIFHSFSIYFLYKKFNELQNTLRY